MSQHTAAPAPPAPTRDAPAYIYLRTQTPLGTMVLAASDAGLAGAWFEGQKHFAGIAPQWRHAADAALLQNAAAQLGEWFAGRRQHFALPLAPQGSAFQHRVWHAIAGVPYGQTCSYGQLAAQLGQQNSARAVGAATGRNPLSIIVPCHRLLSSDGGLTGYAGGLQRKQALLKLETGS